MSDVVVFGSINLDLIFEMETLPAPGQTRLATSLSIQPGGKGANQAVAARLGGAAVHMIGAVGDDEFADAALAVMTRSGVDLGMLRRIPGARTGCASIAIDGGGRNQISVALGANGALVSADLPDGLLQPNTVLVVQMEANSVEVAKVLRRGKLAGMVTVLNLAPALMLPKDTLREVSLLVVNEDEAEALAKEMACAATAEALHAELGTTVVRTLGADGVEAAGPDGTMRVPAPRVRAVDTTAAGDCFVGTLAAELHRSKPLDLALGRACAAAAVACTRHGSQASLPAASEVDVLSTEAYAVDTLP